MGYFPVRYESRVVIYEHKMFIRLATALCFEFFNDEEYIDEVDNCIPMLVLSFR